MVDINWDEAPEGTTHGVDKNSFSVRSFGQWRKITEEEVFYYMGGEWVNREISTPENYLKANPHVIARPIVEAELPEGRLWREDYTHYNTTYKFFFKEGQAVMNIEEDPFHLPEPNYTFWIRHQDTITRFPGAKPKAPVEQPVKKKPVGWWN